MRMVAPLMGLRNDPLAYLDQLKYVLRESRSLMRVAPDKALQDIGIEQIPVAMEVGSTNIIVEMLQRGQHVSFPPRFSVEVVLDSGSLYHIKVQGLRINRTMWIAHAQL